MRPLFTVNVWRNLAVRKDIPFKILDELVRSDASSASIFLCYHKRFDIGIEHTHCRVQ